MSERILNVRNPRNGIKDYKISCTSDAEMKTKSTSLRAAQKSWQGYSIGKKSSILLDWAEQITQYSEELVTAISADTGRYHESVLEVETTVATIKRWTEEAEELLNFPDNNDTNIPFIKSNQIFSPYPLVGIISPWNFPMLLSLIDAIPALLAGCSVLIKPSEVTPRFIEVLNKTLLKVPELNSVLSFVVGDGKTGQSVIDVVDSICFTGSVKTGKIIAEVAAKRFIPAFLELGGKDPVIVCKDADLDIAAKAICWGGMVNAGQSCMSIERVYVDKTIAEAFKKQLVKNVSDLVMNNNDIEKGQVGPVIADYQVTIIKEHLDDAKKHGANILCGGDVAELNGGFWCQPTVLDNVDHTMKIMTEETFAAILSVMEFDNEDQAVELANDSKFGLSAAVFSKDMDKAENIARQLQAGAISINDAALTSLVHSAEKQSFKMSGLGGSRMGVSSIQRFIRKQSLLINKQSSSPWWF